MIKNRVFRGVAVNVKQLSVILLLFSTSFLFACSNNTINQKVPSSLEVHNQLPKNIQLVDLQVYQLSSELRVKGSLKFSARKLRNTRPRGTLLIVIRHNRKVIMRKSIKLNMKGRMPTYSRFDVMLKDTMPAGSHLYLDYIR